MPLDIITSGWKIFQISKIKDNNTNQYSQNYKIYRYRRGRKNSDEVKQVYSYDEVKKCSHKVDLKASVIMKWLLRAF